MGAGASSSVSDNRHVSDKDLHRAREKATTKVKAKAQDTSKIDPRLIRLASASKMTNIPDDHMYGPQWTGVTESTPVLQPQLTNREPSQYRSVACAVWVGCISYRWHAQL
jgi:hypothetical protein